MNSAKEKLRIMGFTLQIVFLNTPDNLLAYYIIKYKDAEVYNTKYNRNLWADMVTPEELVLTFFSDPNLFTILEEKLPEDLPNRTDNLMFITMMIRKYLYYRTTDTSFTDNIFYGFLKAKEILRRSPTDLYNAINKSSDPYIKEHKEEILNSPVFKMNVDSILLI